MINLSPAASDHSVALEAERLTVTRGQLEVLKDLAVKIPRGRWCAIVGPNGAGKSTLLQVLAGILPFQGQVRLLGQPLHQHAAQSRARRVAWLAQSSVQSADDLTAYDVVMLGRLPHQSWLSGQSAADHAAVEHALKLTQAWAWRERALGTLSGGEKQRVLLARLLAVEADILLMDEPLASLDPPQQGKTVVSVLHEVTLALYADDLLVMSNGQIQYAGERDEPALHRAIEAVFEHRITIQPLAARWVALPTLS